MGCGVGQPECLLSDQIPVPGIFQPHVFPTTLLEGFNKYALLSFCSYLVINSVLYIIIQ